MGLTASRPYVTNQIIVENIIQFTQLLLWPILLKIYVDCFSLGVVPRLNLYLSKTANHRLSVGVLGGARGVNMGVLVAFLGSSNC